MMRGVEGIPRGVVSCFQRKESLLQKKIEATIPQEGREGSGGSEQGKVKGIRRDFNEVIHPQKEALSRGD